MNTIIMDVNYVPTSEEFARDTRHRLQLTLAIRLQLELVYRSVHRVREGVADNGGRTSIELVWFILVSVFKIRDVRNLRRYFFDLGCGDGLIPFIVSAMSKHGRRVCGIDYAADRIACCEEWRLRIRDEYRHLPFQFRQFFPRFVRADFTQSDVTHLDFAIRTDKPLIFCNNFNGRWSVANSRGESIQSKLETKLNQCNPGSVVVSFDRMFRSHPSWDEEAFVTTVQRRHLSWTDGVQSNPLEEIDFTIYKYIKGNDGEGRRPRECRTTRVPFPRNTRFL